MAASGFLAPSFVWVGTGRWVSTSARRNASACSVTIPGQRSVHHSKVTFIANPFVSGGVSLDLLRSATPSRSAGPDKLSGGASVAALFSFLGRKIGDREKCKFDLLTAIAPLSRGADATAEDCAKVDEIARELEKLNPTKDPLASTLINGKWKLIYTTSDSILKKSRPQIFRPNGPIYQAINADTLRAQNVETWPYFNQVTANLEPVSGSKVVVLFDYFKIAGLIRVKAPGRARGELEITYLDDDLRISRGDRGNLFVLVMENPDYRVPVEGTTSPD